MLKRRLALCFCLVFCCAQASSKSKERMPGPEQAKIAAPAAQSADIKLPTSTPDKRGTDETPLTVKILSEPRTASQSAKEEYEAREKPDLDRKITEYTWQLAALTAGLLFAAFLQILIFVWQLRLMQASINTARESNEISRKSMETGGRAYVYLDRIDFFKDTRESCYKFQAKWKNFGNTPALKMGPIYVLDPIV